MSRSAGADKSAGSCDDAERNTQVRCTLKKSEILRGKNNFDRLFKKSKRFDGNVLRCYVAVAPPEHARGAAQVQAAFAVKKTLKRAVDRNTVRRRMREAYRLQKAQLIMRAQQTERRLHIVFMYSSPGTNNIELPSFASVQEDIVMFLSNIMRTFC